MLDNGESIEYSMISIRATGLDSLLIMSTKGGEGVWKSLTIVDKGEGGVQDKLTSTMLFFSINKKLKSLIENLISNFLYTTFLYLL